ncbi:MAG: 23S rRNA (adenine(2503)-C(2))-methyltransferase RlmN [Microscillaceae bacterium]
MLWGLFGNFAEKTGLKKQDIRAIAPEMLQNYLAQKGEKPFRARQIQEWLWQKGVHSFAEMTNLSQKMRTWLEEDFAIYPVKVDSVQKSKDGTLKFGFRLHDAHLIEGVLIPTETRMTACVSSQVGCSLTCSFCATGYMPRKRNLEPGEIYDQIRLLHQAAETHYQMPLSNVVFMGMGEPLLNYANVLKGIEKISSPEGWGFSNRRITVSTAGIAKMIRKLGDDEVRFNLALSLHAANDAKRNQIMPINQQNRLETLGEALHYYYQKTRHRVTFEYIVFKDFNDGLQDAEELYQFSKYVPAKVNLIEYNPIAEADFVNTDEDKLTTFAHYLQTRGLVVNIRRSRGKDIDAACGQLAIKENKTASD